MSPIDQAAPRWPLRLLSALDAADARAHALAGPLTPPQLNWKPRPDVWSIGQCLEHLCVANELYLDAIARALIGRERAAVPEITPGFFSRWFMRSYIEESSTPKRARAPKAIAPGTAVDPAILDRFLRSNATAREIVRRASPHDVNRIRFANPFVPVIRFTVGTGLEIVTRHEGRHLRQAERIRAAPDFPAATERAPA